MIRILIVDDDSSRVEQILNSLMSVPMLAKENLEVCYTANDCKLKLSLRHYNILILDVVLPLRAGDRPSPSVGLELLEELIRRNKYHKPDRIIGITANLDDALSYREAFQAKTFALVEAPNNSTSWLTQINDAVMYSIDSKFSSVVDEKDTCVIAVHGIRTFGNWHEQLSKIIQDKSNRVEVCSYKYGFFSLISLLIPFARSHHVDIFARRLNEALSANRSRRIIIISHSFGTFIVAKSLEIIFRFNPDAKVDLLIFAGSMLKSSYDLSVHFRHIPRIINDCGNSDWILCLSQLLVPGAGMAGRVGFFIINSDSFSNRFFQGGHGLYFDKLSLHIQKYWVPAIIGDTVIPSCHPKRDHILRPTFETVLELVGHVNWITIPFVLFVLFFYHESILSIFHDIANFCLN